MRVFFFYVDTGEYIFKYVCVHISGFYRRVADNDAFQYRPLCHQIIHRIKIASEVHPFDSSIILEIRFLFCKHDH